MDDMIVRVGGDLSDLERTAQEAERVGREVAQNVARGITSVRIDTPQLNLEDMRGAGREAGAALVAGITSEFRQLPSALGALRQNIAALAEFADAARASGSAADESALLGWIAELRTTAEQTRGATAETIGLDNAFRTVAEGSLAGRDGLGSAARQLRDIAGGAQAAAAAVRAMATEAPVITQQAPTINANEVRASITTLNLYARTLQTTNADAVAAWRNEAAAIRAQAEAIGLSRDELLKFDAAIQGTESRITRANNVSGQFVNTTGGFTRQGRQASNAMIGVAFALEAVATGAGRADSGLVTALRSIAAVGVAFGPSGLIVSGIAAATAAIVEMVHETTPAQAAVEAYAKTIQGMDKAAAAAETSVRNLTAAQVAQRQLILSDNLRSAQETAKDQLKAIRGAIAGEDFGSLFGKALFSGTEKGGPAYQNALEFRRVAHDSLAAPLADLQAGRINADQFGGAVAQLAQQFPKLTEEARNFLSKFVDPLAASQGVIRGTTVAIGSLTAATRGGNQPASSGLEQQIADARTIAEAQRRGGIAAQTAAQIAVQAFNEWRVGQHGLYADTLTFSAALKGTDATARGVAEAIQRDARTLAAFRTETRVAKDELHDLDAELRGFRERARTPAIAITPGNPSALLPFGPKVQLAPMTLDTTSVITSLHEVDVAMRDVREAQGDLDFSKAFGNPSAIRTADSALHGAAQTARDTIRVVLPLLEAIQDPTVRAAAIEHLRDALRDIGGTAAPINKLTAQLSTMGAAVRGVLSIAEAFGQVDARTRSAFEGVSNFLNSLADARTLLASIRETNPGAGVSSLFGSVAGIGSVVGIVGGIASFASALFGQTAAQREHDEILKRNNEEISSLRADLSGFGRTAAGLGAARSLVLSPDVLRTVFGNGFGTTSLQIDPAALRQFGITLDDLTAIAKQYGIALTDSAGRIIPESLRALGDAIDLAVQKLFTWGSSLSDLTDRQSLFNQITDVDRTDSVAQARDRALGDAEEVFRQMTSRVPALFDRIFGGIDLHSTAGRDTLNQRLTDIITEEMSSEFAAGKGWLAELLRQSGFESLADFNKWLLTADGALDEFSKATDKATDALGNVPNAFKAILDRERFGAIAPGLPGQLPPLAPTPITPPRSPYTPDAPGGGGVLQHFAPGAVVIHADGVSPDEVYDAWLARTTQLARAAGGSLAPLSFAWEPQ